MRVARPSVRESTAALRPTATSSYRRDLLRTAPFPQAVRIPYDLESLALSTARVCVRLPRRAYEYHPVRWRGKITRESGADFMLSSC